MSTRSAEDIAAEYKRILDEGYTPEVEDFLRHVPEDLRAESRERIAEMVAELESVIDDTDTSTRILDTADGKPLAFDLYDLDEDEETDCAPDVDSAVEDPIDEVAEEVVAPVVEEKPQLVKLSREEARAMFARMASRTA